MTIIFLEMMMAERGSAKNTIAAYQRDLEEFTVFITRREKSVLEVETEDIRAFFKTLATAKLSAKSIARKLSSIKQFYKFLCTEDLMQDNPSLALESPKQAKSLPKYLSETEITALINTAYMDKSIEGIRLVALLEVLYASGMRVSELVSLKITGSKITDKNYLIIKGKGNKERLVPLNQSALKALQNYLPLRDHFFTLHNREWLFPSSSKEGHLTRQRLHQLLKELALAATGACCQYRS
ncbi:MAG: hypothetical protein K0R98_1044 [Rickettsiaceae bacterium]|nr:hypothetical protein [Rickettsiaceae bacterium]